jgi:hypothetical protein
LLAGITIMIWSIAGATPASAVLINAAKSTLHHGESYPIASPGGADSTGLLRWRDFRAGDDDKNPVRGMEPASAMRAS